MCASGDCPRPLEGVRVAYYSRCDLSSRLREYKEALHLRDAGAEVRFYGRGNAAPEFLVDAGFSVEMNSLWFTDPVPHVRNRLLSIVATALVRIPARWAWEHFGRWRAVDRAIREFAPHVVHAVDTPSLLGSYREARRMGAKLVYDSHEYWAGFITNQGLKIPQDWGRKVLDLEARVIQHASLVLTTSPEMAERLVKDYGPLPIEVLYNAPSLVDVDPTPAHTPTRFVYHGNMGPDRNVEGLLEAFALVGGDSTLDIYGGYVLDLEARILDAIERLGLAGRVCLHGPFDYRGLPDILREYDVEVYTGLRLDSNMDITLPNKLFDSIVNGLAVLMPDFTSIKRIVDAEHIGVTVDASNTESIARGLSGLIGDPASVTMMKANSVSAARRYSWEVQGDKLVQAYARMLGRDDELLSSSVRVEG